MKLNFYILVSSLLLTLSGCKFSATPENTSQNITEKPIVAEKESVESNQGIENNTSDDDIEVKQKEILDNYNDNDMLEFFSSYTEELYSEFVNSVIHDETGEIAKVTKVTEVEAESKKNYKIYKLSNNLNTYSFHKFYRYELYEECNHTQRAYN